jgi:transposase
MDGVHPTTATKVTCRWIKKGVDKPLATTGNKTRMNLLGALNLETMRVHLESYATLDSEAFTHYFQGLRKTYPKAPQIHLIIDQGPYNTSKETQTVAQGLGIKLQFLPPYSTNLNPIERLWKVMNEHVRNNRFSRTAKEFREAILDFLRQPGPASRPPSSIVSMILFTSSIPQSQLYRV